MSNSISNDAYQYTMSITERQRSLPQACSLVEAVVGRGGIVVCYPCFYCSGFDDYYVYLQHCGQLLANEMLLYFPNLPLSSATKLADDFEVVVGRANATRVCSLKRPVLGTATTQVLEIEFDRMPVEDEVILQSFEEVELKMKPASVESVRRLMEVRLQEKVEEGDRFENLDCVICMEEIDKKMNGLKMPCSHVFHQDCLLQWLNNSNICPLCRCEMPYQD